MITISTVYVVHLAGVAVAGLAATYLSRVF